MKKTILLLSLVGLANCAFATDWVLVAGRYDGSGFLYVDRDSIEYDRAKNIVRGWVMHDGYQYNNLGQIETSKKVKKEYYCSTRQHRSVYMVSYDAEMRVIDSKNLANAEMGSIVPDSVGEATFKSVCTNPPQVIGHYEQPEDAAQAAYDSAVASVFAANVAAFLARPENQIFQEGSPEYNILNDQVIYLQTNQPDLDSVTLLEKARKATAAIIDIPPVPEKRSAPRATPRPAARPAPQPQRTPESRPIVNRL